MAVAPTPADEIVKPTFKKIDVAAQVERLDPTRHNPTVEYEFSNGRKFMRERSHDWQSS